MLVLVHDRERAMTQTDLSKRTPEEVFTHHAQSLGGEDLDAIMMDYADTAIFTSTRSYHNSVLDI